MTYEAYVARLDLQLVAFHCSYLQVHPPGKEQLRTPTYEARTYFVACKLAGLLRRCGRRRAKRMIRAVCTIEGMNRVLGTVTVEDTRGNLHLITDVEPEKMEGVTLGQTLVIVYAEAVALSLEQKHAE